MCVINAVPKTTEYGLLLIYMFEWYVDMHTSRYNP